jgi:GNAT superfamily N-acetyltransferase
MLPFFEIIDATWPAKQSRNMGGFTVRVGGDGIKRISCASLNGAFASASIDTAEEELARLGQEPLFMIRPDHAPDEAALDTALAARGYAIRDEVTIYHAPASRLAGEVPPVTVFAHWPPLQILRDLWHETGVGPARQAVMDRTTGPKAVILGRMADRAAGGAFVAIHRDCAMLHAISVAPQFRRQGLGEYLIREAANWAVESGVTHIALVVTRANPANSLYQSLGMARACDYHYRLKDTK